MSELKVTSPAEYAVLAQKASESADPGELVTLPKTGAVVRLRHADMEALALVGARPVREIVGSGSLSPHCALALVGALPMSLVSAVTGTDEEEDDDLSPEKVEEGQKGLIFMRQMVIDNCLEPRIGFDEAGAVAFVDEQGRGIARLNKDDFSYMFAWISGQEGTDGLQSFRNRKERRALASKSHRKGVQSKAEPVAAGKSSAS